MNCQRTSTFNHTRLATLALSCATIALLGTTATAGDTQISKRPETLVYPPLLFSPPTASQYRTTLSDGTTLFMLPSHEFPLINLSISCMGGRNLDTANLAGLASMTAGMMRLGGTTTMSANDVDERLDFMATNMGVRSQDWTTTASIDCLASNFDASLAILIDTLKNPGFDDAKFKIARADALEGLKQRNDDASSISGREWNYLVYGGDHFESRQPTGPSIEAITVAEMRTMAARIFHPGNMIISVTGDFDPKTLPATLDKALAGWTKGPANAAPVGPTHKIQPGVYYVQKAIPQGKVIIGLESMQRDNPDFYAFTMMNEILGGGGFSSRIMGRVRSDEGLAYSAGSNFRAGIFYPGIFRAGYESKSPTVALALKLIMEEFNKMRDQPVTAAELDIAKASAVETFPSTFASKSAMLGVFVSDEWTKRPAGFWENYRAKITAVTAADIQRVAQKYLVPSKMAILVVGNWADISKGDLAARANMSLFGPATEQPMRDPITLEPISANTSSAAPPAASGG